MMRRGPSGAGRRDSADRTSRRTRGHCPRTNATNPSRAPTVSRRAPSSLSSLHSTPWTMPVRSGRAPFNAVAWTRYLPGAHAYSQINDFTSMAPHASGAARRSERPLFVDGISARRRSPPPGRISTTSSDGDPAASGRVEAVDRLGLLEEPRGERVRGAHHLRERLLRDRRPRGSRSRGRPSGSTGGRCARGPRLAVGNRRTPGGAGRSARPSRCATQRSFRAGSGMRLPSDMGTSTARACRATAGRDSPLALRDGLGDRVGTPRWKEPQLPCLPPVSRVCAPPMPDR